MRPLNRHWSREVDRRAIDDWGMLGLVLMENAGRGAADWIAARTTAADTIAILCGKGNNAGDGFVIARHLEAAGRRVSLILLADPATLQGDALANWRIVERSRIPRGVIDTRGTVLPNRPQRGSASPSLSREATSTPCGAGDPHYDVRAAIARELASPTVIVDAMLGTGATGEPRSPLAEAIALANESPARRIAIDLPTGLDCDTGIASATTFRADETLTFVASKIGFTANGAKAFTGEVHILPIGVPAELLEAIARDAG